MMAIGIINIQMEGKRKAVMDMSKNCAGVHANFELKMADRKPINTCNMNGIIKQINFLEI
jgi:hypothetical protein